MVYDVNSQKTFDNLENWRDEFLSQVCIYDKAELTAVMEIHERLKFNCRPILLTGSTFHLFFWATR